MLGRTLVQLIGAAVVLLGCGARTDLGTAASYPGGAVKRDIMTASCFTVR